MRGGPWCAVVPVRGFAGAKQRLRIALPECAVDELARRLAERTLALLGSLPEIASIVVVTDEREALLPARPGLRVVREERPSGLNAAVRLGLRIARTAAEEAGAGPAQKTLVMHADLPLLTAPELRAALTALEDLGRSAFVPDAEGSGTTALAYFCGDGRPPRFGEGSALRHRSAGFARLALPRSHGLRADLDTGEQLRRYRRSDRAAIESLLEGLEPGGAPGRGARVMAA